MTKRIAYIDRIKGFAILIVVLAHVYLITLNMSESLVYRFCASFEMPLFMFVSGFVAYLPYSSGRNINKKLLRRGVSYLCPAFVIGYILNLYDFIILGNHGLDIKECLIDGQWYLKALAIFVVIQAVLLRCKKLFFEMSLIIVLEIVFYFGWKISPFCNKLFCLEHCFFFFPYFVLGLYSRRYGLVEKIKENNLAFTFAIVGFVCLLNSSFEVHILRFISDRMIKPLCAIIVVTYLFACRESQTSKIEDWLNNIGTKTLDIYIYHGLFIYGMYSCFDLKMLKDIPLFDLNPILYILIALLVTIILVYISIFIGFIVRKSNIMNRVIYGAWWVNTK